MTKTEKRKTVLVLITEGPTDEEFYKRALSTVRTVCSCDRFQVDEIKYICAHGVSNIYSNAVAKFKREIGENKEFAEFIKIACLCYDKDVFKAFPTNPPLNLPKVRKSLRGAGADDIIEIVADGMIEDWFIEDIPGTKKYLRLPTSYKLPSKLKGIDLLQRMFEDASRIYIKGKKVSGYVDKLNVPLILSHHCDQVRKLCEVLGCVCDGTKCASKAR